MDDLNVCHLFRPSAKNLLFVNGKYNIGIGTSVNDY